MKRLSLIFLSFFCAFSLSAQAKKPIIMVIPSDIYCIRSNYITEFKDEGGNVSMVPDFQKAFTSDENLRLAISELSRIMSDRDFPLKDLEQTLKKIENENNEAMLLTGKGGGELLESPIDRLKRTANPDIILDLDFSIKTKGPKKYISFNLRGVDAYTSKVITAASGDGAPSSAATVGLLVEEAVLNHMDNFNTALLEHFNDMFENGREVAITVRMTENAPATLEDEFDFMGETVQLQDVIDYWMDENCVNHRFSRASAGESYIQYEQVRIPLYKTVLGKERAIDTRAFALDLARFLNKEPFNLPYRIYERGLGNVWIILGE